MRGSNLAEKSNILEGQFTPSVLRLVATTNPLDEVISRKPVRQHVYEFVLVMGIALNLIACWMIWKKQIVAPALVLSIATIGLAWLGKNRAELLRPVWKGWMTVGAALGAVVTTALLSIMWLGMFIPLAIGMRLFGKSVMDTSFRSPVPSYFQDRKPEENDFTSLERQY